MAINLEFKKFKRIFAFGCSFTCYRWPTWADLIAVDNKQAKYYNYGLPGLGNLGISVRLTEANKRFNFNEDDLVMVMWSTFCREDRWINGHWFAQGNIFNSQYPLDWVKKYADPFGYLIRDHALIHSTTHYLKSLPCSSLLLKSSSFHFTENPMSLLENKDLYTQLKNLYFNEYNNMPIELQTYLGDWNSVKQEFFDDMSGKPRWTTDFHPFTGMYADYLDKIGIELSDETKQFAADSDRLMKSKPKASEINAKYGHITKLPDVGNPF